MGTRIGTYASQQVINTYLARVQQRIQSTQLQLTSEKRSQDYIGLARDTQRLLGYEVDTQLLTNYKRDNDIQDVYLKSTATAITSLETTVKDFKDLLTSYNTTSPTDESSVKTIQEQAFRALQAMQSYLNTEVNGRFIFAGNRTNTSPVDLGLSTLAAFQSKYDGVNLSYPTTRASHLENFTGNADSTGLKNWLTFTQDNDGNATTAGTGTITATTAQFTNVTVGSHIEITGTANNNGTYEVAAVTNGGKTIEVNTKMLTTETASTSAVLTGTNGTVLNSGTLTNVTFNRTAGTMTAASGTMSALKVGDTFTVSGTAQNNGTFVVESNTGSVIKIKVAKIVDEGTTAQTVVSLTAQSFTFTTGVNTITASAGTPFSGLQPGMKITTAGSANNNTFTIKSVDSPTQITVEENIPATVADADGNDTATVTTATPTLDIVAKSFTYTDNVTSFDTIDSGVAGTFSNVKPGMKMTTTGAINAGNNQTYTIATVSTDGKSVTVLESVTTEVDALNDDTAVISQADGSISSNYYYDGDKFSRDHRASKTREFTMDLNAIDPAFEKAIRAMSIIAQGKFGTVGAWIMRAIPAAKPMP
ncbi:MAG: hypothetical protein JKY27_12125 [Magnetovibrio sp.]|nr:hypothetical protein [Magnetovibrio sp.]